MKFDPFLARFAFVKAFKVHNIRVCDVSAHSFFLYFDILVALKDVIKSKLLF